MRNLDGVYNIRRSVKYLKQKRISNLSFDFTPLVVLIEMRIYINIGIATYESLRRYKNT